MARVRTCSAGRVLSEYKSPVQQPHTPASSNAIGRGSEVVWAKPCRLPSSTLAAPAPASARARCHRARHTRTGCSAWTFPGQHAVIRMVPDAPVATHAPAKSPPSPRSSRYRDAIDGQPKAQCGHYRHGKKGATSAQASRNSQGALCASKESDEDQTGSHTLSHWPGAAPPSLPCLLRRPPLSGG